MLRPEASPACPSCGSSRVAWIFYGLPLSLEVLQPDLDAGLLILGGCGCSENDPQWRCLACGHGWGRPEHLDEMYRLMQEADTSPPSRWQRLRRRLGFTLDEETLLDGLARRLAYAVAGVGVALAVGSVAPPGVGSFVLTIWFLPLLCHAGLRSWIVLFGVMLVPVLGLRALNWRMVGVFAVGMLEAGGLILAVAVLRDWLR